VRNGRQQASRNPETARQAGRQNGMIKTQNGSRQAPAGNEHLAADSKYMLFQARRRRQAGGVNPKRQNVSARNGGRNAGSSKPAGVRRKVNGRRQNENLQTQRRQAPAGSRQASKRQAGRNAGRPATAGP